MAIPGIPSSIGLGPLPDIGQLIYNGVTFSCLYTSTIEGQVVQDEAHRATKYMEYILHVEGIVTLQQGETTTDARWANLRKRLSVHAASLLYTLKGFGPVTVNVQGGSMWDVAFGPVPKVLFFQPLGASAAALIRWQCTFRIPEIPPSEYTGTAIPMLFHRVLQFNYSISLAYDERGYSSWNLRGILEVPITRTAADDRQNRATVDQFRQTWLDLQTDLAIYRVTHRSFDYSRDRRTCEWEVRCEELPPMGLPPSCTLATGTMSVRPIKFKGGQGSMLTGLLWGVSLRCTYTVRADEDRRIAFYAFYALLWWRMWQAPLGYPKLSDPANDQQQPNRRPGLLFRDLNPPAVPNPNTPGAQIWDAVFRAARPSMPRPNRGQAMLTDFSFDEGLYLASDSITIQASWWVLSEWSNLLLATGFSRWMPGSAAGEGPGGNIWAISVGDIAGWRSWLSNQQDPNVDVIVDLNQDP